MADHLEEQELEAEALAAIFDTVFEIISTSATDEVSNHWKISLYPIDTFDEDESLEVNHIGCNLIVKLTQNYPEELPNLEIDIIRGLGPEQKETLESIAMEEAEQFLGMPAIYSVCEKIREWLVDNNVKGLDDQSMHAQMLRKAREQEMKKAQAEKEYESQKIKEELTQAEAEEIAVRKRREEGTPCNKENFEAWKEKFEKELAEKEGNDVDDDTPTDKASKKEAAKRKAEEEEIESRLTGHQLFSQKLGLANLEALEKAAEEAENEEGDIESELNVDDLDVDEDLFDEDDDLDELDFDSDDDDDDSDEEELDI